MSKSKFIQVASFTCLMFALTLGFQNCTGFKVDGGSAQTLASAATSSSSAAQSTNSCLTLESFGGAADGTTDNVIPFQKAVTALASKSGCINLGPGRYLFSTAVTIPIANDQGFRINGSGKEVSVLYWPGSNGGITLARKAHTTFTLSDFSIRTGARGGGTALAITDATGDGTANFQSMNSLNGIVIRGDDGVGANDYWNQGITAMNVSLLNMYNCDITGDSVGTNMSTGLTYAASSNQLAVVLNITSSVFDQMQTGIVLGDNVQGVTVLQTNFGGGPNAIVQNTSQGSSIDQVTINASQFGNNGDEVILSDVAELMITNNLFYVAAGNSSGVVLGTSAGRPFFGGTITGNTFLNVTLKSVGYGIKINESAGNFVITGNAFTQLQYGIYCGATGGTTNIQSNSYNSGVTTPVYPSSSNGACIVGGGSY